MDTGTRVRTFFAALASLVGAYYTYQGLLDDILNQLGWGRASLIVALIGAVGLIIATGAATYYNNDFTEEGVIGTAVTRRLKEHPELGVMVDIEDPEEDDDAEETIEGEE